AAILLGASLGPSNSNGGGNSGDANAVSVTLHESRLVRAARQFNGDLRTLPKIAPVKKWRPEREPPYHVPQIYSGSSRPAQDLGQAASAVPLRSAPAPNITFEGLDFVPWGAGHPPDPNG